MDQTLEHRTGKNSYRMEFAFIIFLSLFSLFGCQRSIVRGQIEVECISESRESHYTVNLDLARETGIIRYRFMGQDAYYRVQSLKSSDGQIAGRAEFWLSRTGEVKGNPINFRYDQSTGALIDGTVIAQCQAVNQDSSG